MLAAPPAVRGGLLTLRVCLPGPGEAPLTAAEAHASAPFIFLGLKQYARSAMAAGSACGALDCCVDAAGALGVEVVESDIRALVEALRATVRLSMPSTLVEQRFLSLMGRCAGYSEAACSWVLDSGGFEAAAAAMRARR